MPRLQHFLSESGYVYGSLFGECSLLASFVMNWPKLRALLEAGERGDIDTLTVEEHLVRAGDPFPFHQRNQLFVDASDEDDLRFEESAAPDGDPLPGPGSAVRQFAVFRSVRPSQ